LDSREHTQKRITRIACLHLLLGFLLPLAPLFPVSLKILSNGFDGVIFALFYLPYCYARGWENDHALFYNQVLAIISIGFILMVLTGSGLLISQSKVLRWGVIIMLPIAFCIFALSFAAGLWALQAVCPPWLQNGPVPSFYFGNILMYHGVAKGAVYIDYKWLIQVAVFSVFYLPLAIYMTASLLRKDTPSPSTGGEWACGSTN